MTAKMKGKFKLISSPTLGKKGVSNHFYYHFFIFFAIKCRSHLELTPLNENCS